MLPLREKEQFGQPLTHSSKLIRLDLILDHSGTEINQFGIRFIRSRARFGPAFIQIVSLRPFVRVRATPGMVHSSFRWRYWPFTVIVVSPCYLSKARSDLSDPPSAKQHARNQESLSSLIQNVHRPGNHSVKIISNLLYEFKEILPITGPVPQFMFGSSGLKFISNQLLVFKQAIPAIGPVLQFLFDSSEKCRLQFISNQLLVFNKAIPAIGSVLKFMFGNSQSLVSVVSRLFPSHCIQGSSYQVQGEWRGQDQQPQSQPATGPLNWSEARVTGCDETLAPESNPKARRADADQQTPVNHFSVRANPA